MSDAETGWEVERDDGVIYVKMTNDNTICSVIVKYKGDEFYSENGSEINNHIPEIMASMPLDDRFEFHKTFCENHFKFIQYCDNRQEELKRQFQSNSLPIVRRISDILIMLNNTISDSYKECFIDSEKQEIDPPKLLRELYDKGGIDFDNGKYKLFSSVPRFIEWCVDNEYISEWKKTSDKLSAEFIHKHLCNTLAFDTVRSAISDAKI